MKRLLWIGDAACDTGFARATHYTLDTLSKEWDVTVLGLNYRGDPHTYPYPIYPAWPGGDLFGIGRCQEIVRKVRPHAIVIQNDPWNIPLYMKTLEEINDVPRPLMIGAIAVDGKNCRGWAMNKLDHVIFWTKFAQYEAIKGGFAKSSSIVPLGVDLDIYKLGDRAAARKLVLPPQCQNGFIVGNVNRNQPRKRIDLTIRYFAEWMHSTGVDDAFLYLHVAPTGDLGYDCDQLAGYYNLHGHMILAEPEVFQGASEAMMANTYHTFDVQVTTTAGEGWGLTTMEGMACGVPQIVPDWAALGEWCGEAAMKVPCDPICSLNKVNVIGGEPDGDLFKLALDKLYRFPEIRAAYRDKGLELAAQPEYRWENIAEAFAKEVAAAFAAYD